MNSRPSLPWRTPSLSVAQRSSSIRRGPFSSNAAIRLRDSGTYAYAPITGAAVSVPNSCCMSPTGRRNGVYATARRVPECQRSCVSFLREALHTRGCRALRIRRVRRRGPRGDASLVPEPVMVRRPNQAIRLIVKAFAFPGK